MRFAGVLRGLIRVSDLINGGLARIAAIALVAVMLILGANIVVRLVADPLEGAFELISMASVIVFGLSIGYAQTKGAHTSIDLVVKRWPKRARVVVGGIVAAASAALFVQLTTSLIVYGSNHRNSGVATELLGIPSWPVVFAVAFGVAALVLALVADVAKAVLAWSSGDPAVNIF